MKVQHLKAQAASSLSPGFDPEVCGFQLAVEQTLSVLRSNQTRADEAFWSPPPPPPPPNHLCTSRLKFAVSSLSPKSLQAPNFEPL